MVSPRARRRGLRRGSRRGLTVLETVVGLAVVTVVVSSAWDGGRVPALGATRSLDRLEDHRAAVAALEGLDRATIVAGERAFDPRLPHTTGRLVAAEVEPGLFEVTATVARAGRPAVAVTTRVLREGPR